MRDGVNINFQKSNKRLVLPTELTMLKNLSAYLKLAGDLPIAKVEYPLAKVTEKNQKFIKREAKEEAPQQIEQESQKDLIVEEEILADQPSKKMISLFDE
jgi:hypothetical protein